MFVFCHDGLLSGRITDLTNFDWYRSDFGQNQKKQVLKRYVGDSGKTHYVVVLVLTRSQVSVLNLASVLQFSELP